MMLHCRVAAAPSTVAAAAADASTALRRRTNVRSAWMEGTAEGVIKNIARLSAYVEGTLRTAKRWHERFFAAAAAALLLLRHQAHGSGNEVTSRILESTRGSRGCFGLASVRYARLLRRPAAVGLPPLRQQYPSTPRAFESWRNL
jgi:hypothetical protein